MQRSLGVTRCRREGDNTVYLEIIECENVGWIHIVRDIPRMSESSEHGNEPSRSLKCGNCCTIWVPIGFWKKTVSGSYVVEVILNIILFRRRSAVTSCPYQSNYYSDCRCKQQGSPSKTFDDQSSDAGTEEHNDANNYSSLCTTNGTSGANKDCLTVEEDCVNAAKLLSCHHAEREIQCPDVPFCSYQISELWFVLHLFFHCGLKPRVIWECPHIAGTK